MSASFFIITPRATISGSHFLYIHAVEEGGYLGGMEDMGGLCVVICVSE